MPTVSVKVNKNNLKGLTPYISEVFGKPLNVTENKSYFVISTQGSFTKNEFFFDKRDFSTADKLINALTSFII